MQETKSKPSEALDNFLTYLREIQQEYDIAQADEHEADNATQDILHNLELCDNKYHDCAKLSLALRTIRQERRKAKDTVLVLQPMIDWINQNQEVVRGLERLLGSVRKAEKGINNRHYCPKTDIVDKTFQRNTK